MFTDTHAHLYSVKFLADRPDMMKRAFAAGVGRIFLPAIDSETHEDLLKLADAHPGKCFPMMGIHPCSVAPDSIEKEFALMLEYFSKRDFVAVGEIGIDLYWDKAQLKLQEEYFAKQIDLAIEKDLPIVIHSRNAFQECYEIVKEKKSTAGGGKLSGIFHCFGDGIPEAEKVIALGGFMLGIGGVLTFKNSGLDKVVEHVGMEHLVLETDAPYLAPVPYRGKRNESSYIVEVAKKIAEIKKISAEEVAAITTENSKKLFRT
ncbi:MAG TPA: TatD family hydrolase [Bacteroidia bacterium]|jgi:TatD DNase family protein|nr:TatD family hydrolase [Bacteroidia bacterium]